MEYQAFFADVGSGEGSRCNHTQRLDTYGCGCFHDCSYCYARAILEFRGNWHPDEPHVASLKKIEKTLDSIPAGSVIKLGGYRHLPLKVKREYLKPILERFEEVSVCEDVYSHWTVWQHTVNANPRDCCNLRGVE